MTRGNASVPLNRHVIVTGGASGIGRAIAAIYAERGWLVSVVARRPVAPDGIGRGRIRVEPADVRDAPALEAAVGRCERESGPCDVLVAAAGIVHPAPFADQPADLFEAQVATNLLGAANAVRAVLPGMQHRRRGGILLIGSGAGLIGLYGYSGYCASKAGLAAFAEALRQEAKPQGIVVSLCMPPDTDTPQLAAELPLRPAASRAIIGSDRAWSAAAVAEFAVRGLERGKAVIYPGAKVKALAWSLGVAPILRGWFDRRVRQALR